MSIDPATTSREGSATSSSRMAFISRLAAMAAQEGPLPQLFDVVVRGVADLLGHEYCKVLELLPDGQEVKLVAGVGWKPGLVGVATVGTGPESQAGYTLSSQEVVMVHDLRTEQRFWGPPLLRDHDVVSGISAIIPGAGAAPWGVLGVHSRSRHPYLPDDAQFVEAVASLLGSAIARRQVAKEADAAQRQTTLALRREEARSAELRRIIAAMGDGVLVFDELDRLLLMNDASGSILGDLEVRSLEDLGRALGIGFVGGDERRQLELHLAGAGRWIELSTYTVGKTATARSGHESRPSTIAVIRDVTDSRAAREAREAFAEMLSHELRTPVTTLYGAAEILARDPNHSKREELALDMRAEADRLRRIIDNLMVLSRVERQALAPMLEPVSLVRLVPLIVRSEQRQAPFHRMDVQVDEEVDPVRADVTYVEQILKNFLSNAVKFSPQGVPIEVTVVSGAAGGVVRVRDGGPGFPLHESEALFDLFYRGQTPKPTAGLGIGLFVSRLLADYMGGSVSARPLDGGGSEFELTLPTYTE